MPTGDVLACSVRQDGWSADLEIEGLATAGATFDFGFNDETAMALVPGAATVVLTVTSQGFRPDGTPGTVIRKVFGTRVLRKPYPDHTALDSGGFGRLKFRIALSDYIYAGDTVSVDVDDGLVVAPAQELPFSKALNLTPTSIRVVGTTPDQVTGTVFACALEGAGDDYVDVFWQAETGKLWCEYGNSGVVTLLSEIVAKSTAFDVTFSLTPAAPAVTYGFFGYDNLQQLAWPTAGLGVSINA